MARTQGEKIDDLSQLTTTLNERLDNVRRDVEGITIRCGKVDDVLTEIKTRLAVIEERLGELKKAKETGSNRWWAILPPLIGVLIGSVLTFVVQILIHKLFP